MAVRMARQAKQAPPPHREAARPPAAQPPEKKKSDAHLKIRQTALPTKREMVCYSCGAEFTTTGRTPVLVCNKCKTVLNQADYTVTAPLTDAIKTVGTVTIPAGVVLTRGTIIARDVILEGSLEGAEVRATNRLQIHAGAGFDEANVKARDLAVGVGFELKLEASASYRHVELAGALHARIEASGVVHIHATGSYVGRLVAPHLVVDEGGGLQGEIRIGG
ncbi:MAG TPA: hypothetical protein VIH35_03545 [Kiritimatiellia bacterium]|jgi:ribosomal protein L37AE/L43A